MSDDDVLALVRPYLEAGVVELAAPEIVYRGIERHLSIGLTKVAWWEIEGLRRIEDVGRANYGPPTEALLRAHEAVVATWLSDRRGIVHWAGDATDIGLRMPVERVVELYAALFALPQHAFFHGCDPAWFLWSEFGETLMFWSEG